MFRQEAGEHTAQAGQFRSVSFCGPNQIRLKDSSMQFSVSVFRRLAGLLLIALMLTGAVSGFSANAAASNISLNRSLLVFGATTSGVSTDSQTFTIENAGAQAVTLSAEGTGSWMSYSHARCATRGVVTVSVDATGLAPGNYSGTISVSETDNDVFPEVVEVRLTVYDSNQLAAPFGSFDAPMNGSVVSGAIAVTGWAVDDIGIDSVQIYWDPIGNESQSRVYIGDAYMVEGARPDVAEMCQDYPQSYRAGWGYMLLTNALPDGGDGTYTLYAVARDLEGNSVTLGSRTITCDNANAVKPFGTIDTPAMGGVASGTSYYNFGWVLTPLPNMIPTDGSTINVYIDGVNVGHPVYNVYNQSIAAFFPGYANSDGASGYFVIDTTRYADGLHTIYWTARDDAGNTDGIGARFFLIQNGNTENSACNQGSGGAL